MGDCDFVMCKQCVDGVCIEHLEIVFKPVVLEQRSVAVLCPVCSGRGAVPSDFYELSQHRFADNSTATSHWPVTCRSCGGRGVLWQ